ncbi:hypothetical protein MFIFM68171_03626 [Madurella fahalii]|uniref:Uncharacterized protein n=1 Tax=Madurella fahalii TaxID=1157608 RepID=A0ABQ0G6M3_9PEZI
MWLEPSGLSAAACINTFRSRILPHFPFIHLPAHVPVPALQRDRPLLFRAIVCVASPTARERQALAAKLKQDLCEAVFLQQGQHEMESQHSGMEQRMDVLLGLLLYAAFGWDDVLISRLTILAMSMVGEMRLDKLASPEVRALAFMNPAVKQLDGQITPQYSLECQRAVLACFALSSVASAQLGQVNALRWTAEMDSYLAAVSGSTDCPTDAALVLQVRLQLLTSKALQLRDRDPAMTAQIATQALVVQLQELWPAVQKHQALLNLPRQEFRAISFLQWAQLTRCVIVLHRLESLQFPDPRWNPAAVRAVVDLPVLLGRIGEKLDMAAREVGEEAGDDVFTRLAGGVRAFRERVGQERAAQKQVGQERVVQEHAIQDRVVQEGCAGAGAAG